MEAFRGGLLTTDIFEMEAWGILPPNMFVLFLASGIFKVNEGMHNV